MNWDDFRLFLGCVQAGSLRRSAEQLNLDAATVGRRIARLEKQLGQRLFVRATEGLCLTAFGQSLLNDVNVMERAAQNVARRSRASDVKGLVRLAVTEGLGTYWILPKLIEWQQANPLLTVDMRVSMEEANVSKLDADIAIQFHRPENPNLRIVRLGVLHTYPFVSVNYKNQFGVPHSLEESLNHRYIQQASPLLDEEAYARLLGVADVAGIVGIRTNTSSAVLYAIEKSAGIGILPTFALALEAPLVPVDMGAEYRLEIWMVYHPEMRHSKRHSIVIEWLRRIFDPKQYPCFRDEFIHPNDLVQLMRENPARQPGKTDAITLQTFAPHRAPSKKVKKLMRA